MHDYYMLKMSVWSITLPLLLRNKYFELVKEVDTTKALSLPFDRSTTIWKDTGIKDVLKFKINNKLDSLDLTSRIFNLREEYKHLEPLIPIRSVSNIYKNKCIVNIWVLPSIKDSMTNINDGLGFLFLFDLKLKKQLKIIPIKFGEIENFTFAK